MPKKILIVDDSLFMRKVLKDILSREPGWKIMEAESGEKALKQFDKEKPDLVLLDIIMPEGEEEGVIVLKRLRKKDPDVKVIMISAVGQNAVVEECKRRGAGDYITKPFDEKQVLKTVDKYLK